ncbi:hypothetical protein OFO10_06115 [Campylobacter sp. VBCF_06 NA8]|uniref:hypothetical protein n=1 Tax=Campylobacter sp. VBCF_06 NA8 TaxID=2983822 RepID=UPI0022E9F990|nr:hypothetical protein [Campylobacter sp. VBCF_06 NA8]MDA3046730.1 hypothetical protein [Campylobacter sp. VBCF_06 NA8]
MSNEVAVIETEFKRFELEQRRAKALASSVFFPSALRAGDMVANAIIVYELANRMQISPFEVAQSVFIIHNKPSFETKFLVARLNQSGKIKGRLLTILNEAKTEAHCEAIDASTGEKLVGATISLEIAKREGWLGKAGSKWATMPELMLRYRAQSFFINEFFPEVKFGMPSSEEVADSVEVVSSRVSAPNLALNSAPSAADSIAQPLDLNAIASEAKNEAKNEAIEAQVVESEASEPARQPKYKVTINKTSEAQGGENE